MADIHVTRELLWAVFRGEIPPGVVAQVGMQHLMELCATCRREISAFQRERTASAGAGVTQVFQLLPGLLSEQRPRFEREQRDAARDLETLLALPREDRAGRVRRARNRFRSPALVRLLIGESRKRIPADPEDAFHLAELARMVAHHNPRMPGVFDLVALATAHMANACRAGNDPRQAEEHFVHARYIIRHHGVTDPEIGGQRRSAPPVGRRGGGTGDPGECPRSGHEHPVRNRIKVSLQKISGTGGMSCASRPSKRPFTRFPNSIEIKASIPFLRLR